MKVPNFVSKLSNQGALIHVLPHIHVEMLGDVEELLSAHGDCPHAILSS